jgi:hypothetical protein
MILRALTYNYLNFWISCLEVGDVGDDDHFSLHHITLRLDELQHMPYALIMEKKRAHLSMSYNTIMIQ